MHNIQITVHKNKQTNQKTAEVKVIECEYKRCILKKYGCQEISLSTSKTSSLGKKSGSTSVTFRDRDRSSWRDYEAPLEAAQL